MVPTIPISTFLLATGITGTLSRVFPLPSRPFPVVNVSDCSRSGDILPPDFPPVYPSPIVVRPGDPLPVNPTEITVPPETTAQPERPLVIDLNRSQLVANEDGLEKAASHAIELLREQKKIGERIARELDQALRVDTLLKVSKELAKEENPRILNYSILPLESAAQSNEKVLLNIIDVLQDYRKNRCKKYECEGILELSSSKVVQVSGDDSPDFPVNVQWLKNDQLRTNKKLSDIQREHGVPKEKLIETGGFRSDEEATVLDRSVKLAAAYAKVLNRPVQLYPLVRLHPYVTRRNSQDRSVFGQIAIVLSEVSPMKTMLRAPPLFPFAVLVVDF
ncbi:hypothetical protein DdX_16698 [Ditylenchus destructor]|uniref:Uncharacterized protein n=1 Tax=Ditylenchus destructor TaxID=166010 RepID=A0AAD4MSS2_9BILA|nr:hypothetical protein DdX_16698 [Ditylenchus destructor]